MTTPIRIKITSNTCAGNVQYLTIRNRRAQLFNAECKKLPLSQICAKSTELMFALEDATDSDSALKAIQKHCGKTKEVTTI